MAGITDTERGARIALYAARRKMLQPSLFPEPLDHRFWRQIEIAAYLQILDCQALRAAQS